MIVGVLVFSGEFWVTTDPGVFKVRTVKRVAPAQRWDIKLLNTIKGTPWDPKAEQIPELPTERQASSKSSRIETETTT